MHSCRINDIAPTVLKTVSSAVRETQIVGGNTFAACHWQADFTVVQTGDLAVTH